MTLRGLTWDHPRGYRSLEALGGPVTWDRQPLDGFESRPIVELAERYDLLVVDHPGIGEAADSRCLIPLDELFGRRELDGWRRGTVGRSFDSYRYRDHQWALPIDAATQVCMVRPDLLDRDVPSTWDAAVSAAEGVGAALPLAGPHALLGFLAICLALGEEPCRNDRLVDAETGRGALELLRAFVERSDADACRSNPIGLLELMSSSDRVALCPLVYGYVTYCGDPGPGRRRLAAVGAPGVAEGRPGTVLGGTGVAVSDRAPVDGTLLGYLRRLASDEVQRTVFPPVGGQPAARAAWEDPEVDRAWNGFYRATRDSVERAWVRPRYPGYVAFQVTGGAVVREALLDGMDPARTLQRLEELYRESREESRR